MNRNDRIEIYRAGLRRRIYWRYVHWNGNILADGAQGYANKADALRGVSAVTGLRQSSSDRFVGYGAGDFSRTVILMDLT